MRQHGPDSDQAVPQGRQGVWEWSKANASHLQKHHGTFRKHEPPHPLWAVQARRGEGSQNQQHVRKQAPKPAHSPITKGPGRCHHHRFACWKFPKSPGPGFWASFHDLHDTVRAVHRPSFARISRRFGWESPGDQRSRNSFQSEAHPLFHGSGLRMDREPENVLPVP